MKCPRCQTDNADEAKFCRECGQSLQPALVCPRCQFSNTAGSKFCINCGQAMGQAEAPSPMPETTAPPVPESGRYKIKRYLGDGGNKKVYLAHDTLLGRDVTYVLTRNPRLSDKANVRAIREFRAFGKMGEQPPNIVGVQDIGEVNGQYYVVFPLMPGGNVETLIQKAPERRLSVARAVAIAKGICSGLEYAHAKGVIHRHLCTGSIWLGADGTAKVGDFGVTQIPDFPFPRDADLSAATFSCAAPEQLTGGDVTFRTDLYALGAILYEMLIGRPPFVGDSGLAIIRQHIGIPPVPPLWHRPDLPAALDSLIMRLLEKEPERRPASASEVREALETAEAARPAKSSPEDQAAQAENPFYRTVFVGREAELDRLKAAFDAAVSAQGSLVVVAGGLGTGKTALVSLLQTYARLRGGRAFVGHCLGEESVSEPYHAFVEILRSQLEGHTVTDLRKELGAAAPGIGLLVPEIRDRLKTPARPRGDPDQERTNLLQAVADLFASAAELQPLLLVIEDLHAADQGTVEMLTHIAGGLDGKKFLIVATYEDLAVGRAHPLPAAMAELRRIPGFDRISLGGLSAGEVRRLCSGIAAADVPLGLAEAVHRQTQGNPLFVQEVVRWLAEEGLIARSEGRWRLAADKMPGLSVPEGLRDVIGRRLFRLSAECNRLLSAAAVVGHGFSPGVLQKVTGASDDDMFSCLEESKKAAIVEESDAARAAPGYRFAHPAFRQVIYEDIDPPTRIRLHLKVARLLETIYGPKLEPHAAELADHFAHSSDPADLRKAVTYGHMASRRAMEVYAYGEAARLLDRAQKVQETLEP